MPNTNLFERGGFHDMPLPSTGVAGRGKEVPLHRAEYVLGGRGRNDTEEDASEGLVRKKT